MVSSQWKIQRFLTELASARPTPGGGSAAALAGALGCSLGLMVGRILLGRKGLERGDRLNIKNILRKIEIHRNRLQRLIREDSAAFLQLVKAQRVGRGAKAAERRAVDSPVEIGRASAACLKALKALEPYTGPYLGSDLKAARALLRGASEAARVTAQMNLLDKRHPRVREDL